MGSMVDVAIYYPTQNALFADYGTKTVSPTAMFAMNFFESATISVTQITFTSPSNTSGDFGPGFNGIVYDFLNSGNLITGVTLDGATTLLGFTQSDMTLTSDGAGGQFVELNVAGLHYNPSDNRHSGRCNRFFRCSRTLLLRTVGTWRDRFGRWRVLPPSDGCCRLNKSVRQMRGRSLFLACRMATMM